jgi:hypothetical protein
MSLSKQAIEELRECLGADSDLVIPRLENIIAKFPQVRGSLADDLRRQRGELEKGIRKLRSYITALRRVQLASDALADIQSVFAIDVLRAPEDLNRIEQGTIALVASLQKILDSPVYRKTRGRRRNERRRWLARLVAYVLQCHGIVLTKTHAGGSFNTVLLRVIEAAEGKMPPEDLFPLVRETVDLYQTMAAKPDQPLLVLARILGLPAPLRDTVKPSA